MSAIRTGPDVDIGDLSRPAGVLQVVTVQRPDVCWSPVSPKSKAWLFARLRTVKPARVSQRRVRRRRLEGETVRDFRPRTSRCRPSRASLRGSRERRLHGAPGRRRRRTCAPPSGGRSRDRAHDDVADGRDRDGRVGRRRDPGLGRRWRRLRRLAPTPARWPGRRLPATRFRPSPSVSTIANATPAASRARAASAPMRQRRDARRLAARRLAQAELSCTPWSMTLSISRPAGSELTSEGSTRPCLHC